VFTGIIETVGSIQEMHRSQSGATMTVSARAIAAELKVGDSIAVNGACLTAVSCTSVSFSCDLSAETLVRTGFDRLKGGDRVNLERALLVGSRLNGHFVQGHIDGVGTFLSAIPSGEGCLITIAFPAALARYMVLKGSIAVDGISLTIAALDGGAFSVAVIPHTLQETNLGGLRPGNSVNLEADLLAQYIERFFQLGITMERPSGLSLDYLKEQGF
jgi:riboflavin synthase